MALVERAHTIIIICNRIINEKTLYLYPIIPFTLIKSQVVSAKYLVLSYAYQHYYMRSFVPKRSVLYNWYRADVV